MHTNHTTGYTPFSSTNQFSSTAPAMYQHIVVGHTTAGPAIAPIATPVYSGPAKGPRRSHMDGGDLVGDYHGEYDPINNRYWDENEWAWVEVNPTYDPTHLPDIGTPVGDPPMLLILVFACLYILRSRIYALCHNWWSKYKKNRINANF